jgi:hypothetical protein
MKKQLQNLSLIALFFAISGVIMAAPMTAPVRYMDIPATNEVMTIDGVAEDDYSASQSTTAFNIAGSTGADADFTATFQVCLMTMLAKFLTQPALIHGHGITLKFS